MKTEQEFSISHEQFVDGTNETIKIITGYLENLKKTYIKTQNPICKIEITQDLERLANIKKLYFIYLILVESGIELQPIVLFADKKAMFGFRRKKETEFAEKWYKIIAKKENGKNMVI